MTIEAPAWWYPQPDCGPLAKSLPWLLSPISALYGTVAGHRMARAPAYVSGLPVICIGNFTAGGTGKTPLAIHVAEKLLALGARPAFLTRGYGGKISGPYDVTPDHDIAERTGDEPLLLARVAPTVICHDRALGARHIERSDATVIIMDDGMQNPSLAKTLTLAVVDATRGLGNGWTIPSGPLRAPIEQQSQLADVVVVNGRPNAGLCTRLAPENFSGTLLTGHLKPNAGTIDLSGKRVVAFTGIGNPARFHRTLDGCGAITTARLNFPDHHTFTDAEAEDILQTAARETATIVTTEKDHVRLQGVKAGSTRATLHERSYALPVTFEFEGNNAARLDALLDMLVRQHQSA